MARIQLKNGFVFENAEPLSGGSFEVIRADGKKKRYPLSQLYSVNDFVLHQDPKGGKMIYHYVHEMTIGGITCFVRKATTNPALHILERYNASIDAKHPVGKIDANGEVQDRINALNTAEYEFGLFIMRLAKLGYDFTLSVMENNDLSQMPPEVLDRLLDKCNFAHGTPTQSIFLRVDGVEGFGLSMLGLSIKMAKKSAKRLQEYIRLIGAYIYLPKGNELGGLVLLTPKVKGKPILYDGHSYVSRTFAKWCGESIENPARRLEWDERIDDGTLVEVSLRGLEENGEWKGTATVRPDDEMIGGAHIVSHSENLKKELCTLPTINDAGEVVPAWSLWTIWEHKPHHMAVWDAQSEIDFKLALPERAIHSDILRRVEKMRETIASGELPDFITENSNRAHDEGGVPNVEKLSSSMNKVWMRWPFDVRTSVNLPYLALNGEVRRMDGDKDPSGQYHLKLWVPMTNAVLVSVISEASAKELGNFTFPHHTDKNVCFYDSRIGFIMPNKRFIEGFEYHGTWDMDDMVKVIRILAWCSNTETLKLHKGKTVPSTSIFPTKESEAREMVLLIRSPNGPGEWTIEECQTNTLPIPQGMRHNDLTVVDIAEMPLPSTELAKKVKVLPMPSTTVYSGQEMIKADAREMITSQWTNPGVGSYCNPMMLHSSIKEGYPKVMLGKMSDIIDELQQGIDRAAFAAIGKENESILEQLYGSKMDRSLAFTRIRDYKIRRNFRLFEDRYTRMHKVYQDAIKTIDTELKLHVLQMRHVQPLVNQVRAMKFSDAYTKAAGEFYSKYDLRLRQCDARFNSDGVKNPFNKMMVQHYHKVGMEEIVEEMVQYIEAREESKRYYFVLALWNYILTPKAKGEVSEKAQPYGIVDRIIFQASADGHSNVMDILVEALSFIGIS